MLNEEQIGQDNQGSSLLANVNAGIGMLVGHEPEHQIDLNPFIGPLPLGDLAQKELDEKDKAKSIKEFLGENDLEFDNIDKGVLDPILKCI